MRAVLVGFVVGLIEGLAWGSWLWLIIHLWLD